jgi:L-iditol 2-dehydrogenase
MKAAVLTGIRRMEIIDVPKPAIENDTDVLLKIRVVGVCGSDMHYYRLGRIGSKVVKYPYMVGHECSAIVEEVGKKVKRVKPGDEVAVEPAISCHRCPQCKMGRENTCYNLKFLGTPGEGNGCLCEYIVMPQENCFPTKGKITLEEAALCEPFAIGVYVIQQSGFSKEDFLLQRPIRHFDRSDALRRGAEKSIKKDSSATLGMTFSTERKNDKIAILGCGPIGLSCLIAAKVLKTGKIYATDKLDYRVDFAMKAGADWAGNPAQCDIVKAIYEMQPDGVDIVYECAGEQEAIDQAIELLRPGGKLMLVGIPEVDRVSFPIDKIRRKELTIINDRRQNRCTEKAIDLVASGKAKIKSFATHRFKLEQAKEAFDLVSDYRDGVIKAMIEV